MPNFKDLLNRFEHTINNLHNQLENNLPNFENAEFFQVFDKTFEDNLSAQGKNTYGIGLNQDMLTTLHEEMRNKLNQDYKEILTHAATEVQKNFNPAATVDSAQRQLELKLNQTKQSLIKKLNDELIKQDQEFKNPADKKALDTAFSNYLDNIGKKYKDNLNEVNSIWSKLAAFKLHINNEEKGLQAKDPNATFGVNATDPDKLSIGIAPDPTTGWRIDIDNLKKRLMYRMANQKPGEKFHITLTIPDRAGSVRQIGEIGFQCRSPLVALFALLFFYFLAMFRNNDVEKMIEAFEKVIKKEGIAIDPNTISYTIKQIDNNGKSTVIKEKGPLSSEYAIRLQEANRELKENLKKEHETVKKTNSLEPGYRSDAGYSSGSESEEEQIQEENFSSPRLR